MGSLQDGRPQKALGLTKGCNVEIVDVRIAYRESLLLVTFAVKLNWGLGYA
jgi:hypothetical protein